jgi:hypothetical protein
MWRVKTLPPEQIALCHPVRRRASSATGGPYAASRRTTGEFQDEDQTAPIQFFFGLLPARFKTASPPLAKFVGQLPHPMKVSYSSLLKNMGDETATYQEVLDAIHKYQMTLTNMAAHTRRTYAAIADTEIPKATISLMGHT